MNLEHCFTARMAVQSITILSELKMSSFGPYAGALHQLRYQLHSVEGRAKCLMFLNVVNSRLVYTLLDKAVNPYV